VIDISEYYKQSLNVDRVDPARATMAPIPLFARWAR